VDASELQKIKRILNGIFVLLLVVLAACLYWLLPSLDNFFLRYIHPNKLAVLISVALLCLFLIAALLAYIYQRKSVEILNKFINSEINEKAQLSHYQIITKYSNDVILLMDQKGLIVEVNQQALKAYGYTRKEIINQNVVLVFAPKSIRGMSKIVKAFESREGIIFEAIHRKKNGDEFPVEISARVIEIGGDTLIQNSIRDISEKRKIVEELEFSRTLLLKVFDSLEEAIFLINPLERKIENVNHAAIKMFGYDRDDLLERGSDLLFGDALQFESFIKQSFSIYSKQDFFETELTMKRKNGEEIPIYFYGKGLVDAKNKFSLIIGVVRDISLVKKTEQTLIEAKNRAEEMNRLKSNFLANMSHELRTPLISILGFAEIMTDASEDLTIQEASCNILQGGKRLLDTLNLILQFSKIEAEKISLKKVTVDVANVLKELSEKYKPFARERGLQLFVENYTDECFAETDDEMFKEIIAQLINNALKFTEEGSVSLVLKKSEDEKSFIIEIIDTGIGIPEVNQSIIFEEFRQGSEGISRGYEGVGLGLTIVKKYTAFLKGTVHLSSRVEGGSTFTLTFPLAATGKHAITKVQDEKKKPFSLAEFFEKTKNESSLPLVLLVEDDPSTSDVITIFLRKVCKLEYANRADKAIQKAAEKKYDAILMDINLGRGPGGKEAMELIKMNTTNSDTPVIAVTAYTLDNEKETLLNSGFADYISKPFNKSEIIEILTTQLHKSD